VVVGLATVPDTPLAVTTDTEVTVPVPPPLLPFSFCIACRIVSVAATVPAPDTYPVITLPITAELVKVTEFPTEVASPVRLALVTTVAELPTEVTPPVRLALVTTVAALPTDVTPPVKLALVPTFPAVSPAAVPVMLVPTRAEGVPKAGVTKVGLVARTTAPLPVVPLVI
jgi:hypothetical protein